jgi:hypothetical protein
MSDVAAEMTAIITARARALGLDNVRTCVLDLEQIEQPDGLRRRALSRRSCSRSIRAGAECAACYDPADVWPPSCGDRVLAIRGSPSCSTQ